MENNNVTETKKRKPATAKFKVGQVWYVAMKENPRDCIDVTILEILSNRRVLVKYNTKKGTTHTYSAEELHKKPEQTMPGAKSKARAVEMMAEKKLMEQKKGIKQSLQDKVAQLSHKGCAIKNCDGKYVLKNVPGASINADTIEELDQYVDEKLVEISAFKEDMAAMKYKYLYITDKRGTALYKIVAISNKRMVIQCNWAREQDVEIDPALVIDDELVRMYKIEKSSYGERVRQKAENKARAERKLA